MSQQVNRYCYGHKYLFCSFDRRVKSYSVNKAPGTGLMITKIPPSVSYRRFLFFFFSPFHLCGGKASGRSWKGEATREHGLYVCVGSGTGNSSHFCYWLDVWPRANHVSSVGLAPPCLSLGVIQRCVKGCCSDLEHHKLMFCSLKSCGKWAFLSMATVFNLRILSSEAQKLLCSRISAQFGTPAFPPLLSSWPQKSHNTEHLYCRDSGSESSHSHPCDCHIA